MAKSDQVKTQLRIPATLHMRLALAIAENGRSMNAEIIRRLEETFPADVLAVLLQRRRDELDMINSQIAQDHWQGVEIRESGKKAA